MTQSTCTIRPARNTDIPAIIQLTRHWAAEETTYGIVPSPFDFLAEHLGPYFWVAAHDSQLVGFICGAIQRSEGLAIIPAEEMYLEIEDLYVLPEFRCCGIGTQLVETVLGVATGQGVTAGLVHSATKDWRRIVHFYQQFGFKMWYVQMYR